MGFLHVILLPCGASLSLDVGLLLFAPPEYGEGRLAVLRHMPGMIKPVPARGTFVGKRPLRHDKMIPQQHSIERPGRCDELIPRIREDDAFDERVDRGILDADQIARTMLARRMRAPVIALLIARRERFLPVGDDDVEIPFAQTVGVLYVVDQADTDLYSYPLQRWLIEQDHSLKVLVSNQELDGHLLFGIGIDQNEVPNFVPRLREQIDRLEQICALCFIVRSERIP